MLVGTLALVLVDFLLLNLGAKDTSRIGVIPRLPQQEKSDLNETEWKQSMELVVQHIRRGACASIRASCASFLMIPGES